MSLMQRVQKTQKLQKVLKFKFGLIALLSFILSSCNITKVPLAYCPASVHGAYVTKTLKVGKVYDDRKEYGYTTGDPREIGEVSWKQSIAPSIYYGTTPFNNTLQTALHMSLENAGYKLTSIHPERTLYTRIDKVKLDLEGKNNQQRTLYCGIHVDFAVVDDSKPIDFVNLSSRKVLWRSSMVGEGSVDVPMTDLNSIKQDVAVSSVKQVVNKALDDAVLQLERSKGFNKVLR